jgi:hypothetical protein
MNRSSDLRVIDRGTDRVSRCDFQIENRRGEEEERERDKGDEERESEAERLRGGKTSLFLAENSLFFRRVELRKREERKGKGAFSEKIRKKRRES